MKSIKLSLVFLFLLGSTVGNAAWADRGHGHVGIYLGVPLFGSGYYSGPGYYGSSYYGSSFYGSSIYGSSYYGPSYYPSYGYPYYAAPTVITIPASPPVYIEQSTVPSPPPPNSSNSWYYCNDPDGYYPYIKRCPSGWQRIEPTR